MGDCLPHTFWLVLSLKSSQHQQLLSRTKRLFNDLDRLGVEEFAEIFKYNYFTSEIPKDHEKYQEVLNFLMVCVIEKYSESDLLRYFSPSSLSQKENRPEYSAHSSRVGHWFQLIGYWLRQLFNKPTYQFNPASSLLSGSLKQLKTSLNKKSYIENSVDVDFRTNLSAVRIQLENKLIHSQFEDRANARIIERETAVAEREEVLSQKEKNFLEKTEALGKSQESFQEKYTLWVGEQEASERKMQDLQKENQALGETISNLKKAKSDEKGYIRHLEADIFKLGEKLEEKAQESKNNSEKPRLSRTASLSSFFSCLSSVEDISSSIAVDKLSTPLQKKF
ncbi:hypothetical protein FQR65_LT11252 [Abscondita terminalis]|nr:hypothetical protein FQR65_LT11252 [Abscondita terminalis]